jgi:hypothetical protein
VEGQEGKEGTRSLSLFLIRIEEKAVCLSFSSSFLSEEMRKKKRKERNKGLIDGQINGPEMKAVDLSETLLTTYQISRRHIPENCVVQNYYRFVIRNCFWQLLLGVQFIRMLPVVMVESSEHAHGTERGIMLQIYRHRAATCLRIKNLRISLSTYCVYVFLCFSGYRGIVSIKALIICP